MKFFTIAAFVALASEALSLSINPKDSHKFSLFDHEAKHNSLEINNHLGAKHESRGEINNHLGAKHESRDAINHLGGDKHKLRTVDHNDDSTDLYD